MFDKAIYGPDTLNRRDFLKSAASKGVGTALGFSMLSNLNCQTIAQDMPQRVLGRTNLSVSLLGFGSTQVKDTAVYQRAVELGVNYFHMGDADPTYNLEACAALLPFREQIYIAYMSYPKASRTELLEDLDNYLEQSGFGYLDVWFVMTPRTEVMNVFRDAIAEALDAGKTRWTGITTHSLDQDVDHLTLPDSPIDVVMLTYNYLSTPTDSEKLGRLSAAGLGITPMKPLAGKFYDETTANPAPLLHWLAADTRIHCIPVIMNTIEQVEQNVAAIKQPFSEADQDMLRSLAAYNTQRFCRMCGACNGKCPNGLAVSDLVRTAMYVDGYKDVHRARSSMMSIPVENRQICCRQCDTCLVHCPNGVAVRDRICNVQAWLT